MSKKQKSLKVISCDELNENMIELLYIFLQNKHNIYNKDKTISSSILWDVIYLRKLFSKSIYSKKSSKYRVKYNYIILEDNKIITFFTLNHILKKSDFNLLELQFILDNKILNDNNVLNDIKKLIMDEYTKITHILINNSIMVLYLPLDMENSDFMNIMINNLEYGFNDDQTFIKTYQVYFQISSIHSNNSKISKSKISKSTIIKNLLDNFGLNTIYNSLSIRESTRQSTKKLTKKTIAIPEFKVITKNIFDIKEIQDLPEYDYDYIKVYSIKIASSFISYLLNTKIHNINEFIKNRFFRGSIKFNNNIYNLYKEIFKFTYENINIKKINDSLFNIDYLLKINNTFIYTINNLYCENIMKRYNKKLIISNAIDTITYFSSFKIDIIRSKSNVNYLEDIKNIKQINSNIIITNNNNELKNAMFKNNKKYSFILIENYYPNYDILFNQSLICKISTILYSILNSLKYINKDGSILLSIFLNSLNIPIIQKTFNFILSLFENFNIDILVQNRNYLLLKNFKGLNQYSEKIINILLNIFNQFEKEELSSNDIYNLILTNKFTYKINLLNNFNENNIQNKIIYDIDGFSSNISNKIKEIQTYINNYNNKINTILLEYLKIDNKNLENIYIKIIKQRHVKILEFIDKNKLFINTNVNNIIKLLQQ
jgi:hypothetical protein